MSHILFTTGHLIIILLNRVIDSTTIILFPAWPELFPAANLIRYQCARGAATVDRFKLEQQMLTGCRQRF